MTVAPARARVIRGNHRAVLPDRHDSAIDETGTTRLETFSDGVFAIAAFYLPSAALFAER